MSLRSPYQWRLDLRLAKILAALPEDVIWIVRCFCFDPPHPGCAHLRLGSMTFRSRVDVTRVATGFKHLAFIAADGRLFAHGSNALGQCGVPAETVTLTDAPVMVMEGVTDISCGLAFTVATTKAMTYFCGAYNYHPITREHDRCISISDRWLPLCFSIPPSRVLACGGYVSMRWDTFNMALPVLSDVGRNAGPLPFKESFVWKKKRYSGLLMGPRPRWSVADVDHGALCDACGRPLHGRVVVITGCCVLHMDCAGICFVKAGRCPCGKTLTRPKSIGV